MAELLLKEEVYAIVGAAMEVYNVLGPGFFEGVYQEALELELQMQGVVFESQKNLDIFYKGHRLTKQYIPDLIVNEQLIVELKALDYLTSRDEAQVINYLKVTGLPVALLLNFGAFGKLEWKRLVLTKK